MGTNKENAVESMVCDVPHLRTMDCNEFLAPPVESQHTRDTKFAGDLQLTLLYMPSRFGESWIYGVWVTPAGSCPQKSAFWGKDR